MTGGGARVLASLQRDVDDAGVGVEGGVLARIEAKDRDVVGGDNAGQVVTENAAGVGI